MTDGQEWGERLSQFRESLITKDITTAEADPKTRLGPNEWSDRLDAFRKSLSEHQSNLLDVSGPYAKETALLQTQPRISPESPRLSETKDVNSMCSTRAVSPQQGCVREIKPANTEDEKNKTILLAEELSHIQRLAEWLVNCIKVGDTPEDVCYQVLSTKDCLPQSATKKIEEEIIMHLVDECCALCSGKPFSSGVSSCLEQMISRLFNGGMGERALSKLELMGRPLNQKGGSAKPDEEALVARMMGEMEELKLENTRLREELERSIQSMKELIKERDKPSQNIPDLRSICLMLEELVGDAKDEQAQCIRQSIYHLEQVNDLEEAQKRRSIEDQPSIASEPIPAASKETPDAKDSSTKETNAKDSSAPETPQTPVRLGAIPNCIQQPPNATPTKTIAWSSQPFKPSITPIPPTKLLSFMNSAAMSDTRPATGRATPSVSAMISPSHDIRTTAFSPQPPSPTRNMKSSVGNPGNIYRGSDGFKINFQLQPLRRPNFDFVNATVDTGKQPERITNEQRKTTWNGIAPNALPVTRLASAPTMYVPSTPAQVNLVR